MQLNKPSHWRYVGRHPGHAAKVAAVARLLAAEGPMTSWKIEVRLRRAYGLGVGEKGVRFILLSSPWFTPGPGRTRSLWAVSPAYHRHREEADRADRARKIAAARRERAARRRLRRLAVGLGEFAARGDAVE